MGRMREVCGAVSGAFMVLGMLRGYDDPDNADAKAAHYAMLQDFGDETTYRSQPTFVFTLDVEGRTEYIYFGDRWCYNPDRSVTLQGKDPLYFYKQSSFVLLPIRFEGERPYIEWQEKTEV